MQLVLLSLLIQGKGVEVLLDDHGWVLTNVFVEVKLSLCVIDLSELQLRGLLLQRCAIGHFQPIFNQ